MTTRKPVILSIAKNLVPFVQQAQLSIARTAKYAQQEQEEIKKIQVQRERA
jgi:hypothetical protein